MPPKKETGGPSQRPHNKPSSPRTNQGPSRPNQSKSKPFYKKQTSSRPTHSRQGEVNKQTGPSRPNQSKSKPFYKKQNNPKPTISRQGEVNKQTGPPRPRTDNVGPKKRKRPSRPMPRSAPKLKQRVVGNFELKKDNNGELPEAVRIIPLGGFEEIGRNMMVLEYKNDSIIIDAGIQFPEDETPGIDYIIPNVAYLKDKVKNIRGMLITHGHLDHIGAIPHIMKEIGNPTIYATPLTDAVIKRRQTEWPDAPKLDIEHINENSVVKLGAFTISFFPVTHNIPEGVGMRIKTPIGTIIHPGEFKFDYDKNMKPVGLEAFAELGKEKPLLLMLDSTNAEEPGRSIPEWQVEENIEKLLAEARGRVIVATFSSLLDRLAQIAHIADKLGRKIAITGRSMEANFAIAQELGIIKIRKGVIVPIKEIDKYHESKILILTTGAQGEEFAGLSRMASNTHRDVKLHSGDTIIFSSSVIPGNEKPIQFLRDNLARRGVVLYHYKHLKIHSGGHAPKEELRDTMNLVKPKFFMPIHGHFYMRTVNAKTAETTGVKPENIVVGDNGQVIEITKDKIRLLKEIVPTNYVMVHGLGVGDIGTVVIRDRQQLAGDGMFVVIAVINSKTGKVIGNPDIISRGFVYLRESKELLRETRKLVRTIVESATANNRSINEMDVKDEIRKKISRFLFKKTERNPMVLPVIIEI